MNSIVVTREDFKELGIDSYWHKLVELKIEINQNDLLESICAHYKTTQKNVMSGKRFRNNIKAKKLYMVMAYDVLNSEIDFLGKSLKDVANDVGINNHATVIHHIKEFELDCMYYKPFRDDIYNFAENKLNSPYKEKLIKYVDKIEEKKLVRLK